MSSHHAERSWWAVIERSIASPSLLNSGGASAFSLRCAIGMYTAPPFPKTSIDVRSTRMRSDTCPSINGSGARLLPQINAAYQAGDRTRFR